MRCENCKMIISDRFKPDPVLQPGYTAVAPPREWVGLTDDEIYEAVENSNSVLVKDMARYIEAKLKEKNT